MFPTHMVISNETFQVTISNSDVKFRIWNTDICAKLTPTPSEPIPIKIDTIDMDFLELIIKQQLKTKTKFQIAKEVSSIIGYLLTLVDAAENNDEKYTYILMSAFPNELIRACLMINTD